MSWSTYVGTDTPLLMILGTLVASNVMQKSEPDENKITLATLSFISYYQ